MATKFGKSEVPQTDQFQENAYWRRLADQDIQDAIKMADAKFVREQLELSKRRKEKFWEGVVNLCLGILLVAVVIFLISINAN